MGNTIKIKNPHAAAIIWNFEERLGLEPVEESQVAKVNQKIISSISLIDISTSKSKSEPVGKFELTLAPTKNWVSTLTSGSWICLLMANEPLTQNDLTLANSKKVKMIGKIETVRVNVEVNPQTGALSTTYKVAGVDWAHILENFLYIDPFIDPKNNTIGAATFITILENLRKANNVPGIGTVAENLTALLKIIGTPLDGKFTDAGQQINRIAEAQFSFVMPAAMTNFFRFKKIQASNQGSSNIVDAIELVQGKLRAVDSYIDVGEASGFIDPTSMTGTHTIWQLLVENSNPTLSEMYCEMRWESVGSANSVREVPTLAVYNRIRPFIFRDRNNTVKRLKESLSKEKFGSKSQQQRAEEVADETMKIVSQFQLVKTHKIDLTDVLRVDAGTNWRDKFNFVEIKPNIPNYEIFGTWIKTTAQVADPAAFSREGFRPFISQTNQWPTAATIPPDDKGKKKNVMKIDFDFLAGWKHILREWYFDNHRLLNGSVTIIGQDRYIAVGDNIMVDMKVLGPTPNMNSGALRSGGGFLLAHVESVNNNFTVNPQTGARTFTTTIQFVRGILVDSSKRLLGEGKIDAKASASAAITDKNYKNTVATSTAADPDVDRLRGR